MQKLEGTIHQIPSLETFKIKGNSSVWMHLYTSYGIPRDKFQEVYHQVITSGQQALNLSRPVWFAFSDFENFRIPNIHMEALPGPDGEMVIHPHFFDTVLTKSNIVYVSTPYRDGETIFEGAKNILEKIRGIFCLLFGRNFLYQKILSAEVFNHPSSNINQVTEDLRFCSIAEGPFLHTQNTHEAEEIAIALGGLNGEERVRIDSALHYLVRGLEDDDTFLFIWTAIEMLCGNKENNAGFVRQALEQIYPDKNVNDDLGFKKLKDLRNNWLHKGVIPSLNHDVIRYMQLMFLDLLRLKLNLPPKQHLWAICSSKNFNLEDVGLPSNNVPRIRAMIREASQDEMNLRSALWCKVETS